MRQAAGRFFVLVLGAGAAISLAVAAQSAPPPRSTADGIYAKAQAEQGAALYKASCASCHGADLSGTGQSPPLGGDDFFANWKGRSLAELFDKIRTSMPADHPGSLGAEETTDLIAYMLHESGFAPGAELPADHAALGSIRIDPPPSH